MCKVRRVKIVKRGPLLQVLSDKWRRSFHTKKKTNFFHSGMSNFGLIWISLTWDVERILSSTTHSHLLRGCGYLFFLIQNTTNIYIYIFQIFQGTCSWGCGLKCPSTTPTTFQVYFFIYHKCKHCNFTRKFHSFWDIQSKSSLSQALKYDVKILHRWLLANLIIIHLILNTLPLIIFIRKYL